KSGVMRVRVIEVKAGDTLTIDGATGEIMLGEVPTVEPELSGDFAKLMSWADKLRRLKARTNAATPTDCRTAVRFACEGIGLCRTALMPFVAGRIVRVRETSLAEVVAGRRRALAKLLRMQREDFVESFKIMRGLPVTIRLLDQPLHE